METLDLIKNLNEATFAKGGDVKKISNIRQIKDEMSEKIVWVCDPIMGLKTKFMFLDVAVNALEVRGYIFQN